MLRTSQSVAGASIVPKPVTYHYGRFPPKDIDWPRLIPLIGPAAGAVARYDGLLSAIPDPGVLLSPLMTQEAVLSSRIEGTQTTMGEVLEYEAGQRASTPAQQADILEVINYRSAMREAERLLADLPWSERVVRAAHRVLMQGVRGQHKTPGDYRKTQNWIGPPGCSIEEARFVPIRTNELPTGMRLWEAFAHAEAQDKLVQVGIVHAEFEALHPFLDGNGRLGRMLIPLLMWNLGLIRRPMFYISAYFEGRRDEYYDRLLGVSQDDGWTGWLEFFLHAVRVQAEDNLAKAQSIMDLYQSLKNRVPEVTHSQYAIRALDWIFERPVFQSSDFVASSGIPEPTARRFLRVLREDGVLSVLIPSSGRRPAMLMFPELLNRAEGIGIF